MSFTDITKQTWEVECMGCAITDGTVSNPGGIITANSSFIEHYRYRKHYERDQYPFHGPLVDFTYRLSDMIRVGAELGVHFMTMSFNDQAHIFVDLPIRGIVRFQSGPVFLQPHVGAYIGLSGLEGSWLDLGTKLGFGGSRLKFFLEQEYLVSLSADAKSYLRFGLGVLYNIFNF